MRIKTWQVIGAGLLIMAALPALLPSRTAAATIESEDDDDSLAAPPTPLDSSKDGSDMGSSGKSDLGQAAAKVRIDDNIGFFYFVKSGFVVSDPSRVPSMGKVLGSFEGEISYSDPKKLYIELSPAASSVKAGDLLVVYRDQDYIREPHSGFAGYWVQNLAVIKVLEVQKKECLVQVNKGVATFETGDKVKSYDDEIKRWKQAQVKKDLPNYPIRCYVITGDEPSSRTVWGLNDVILLSAGTKKGVVEGQTFRLSRGINRGSESDTIHDPEGSARVFYAGPDCSMAQITNSEKPIESGYEARYEP